MAPAIDITSKRFGKLVAIRRVGTTKAKKALWFCQCDCGGEAVTTTGALTSGNTSSCGCNQVEHLLKVRKPWSKPGPGMERAEYGKTNYPRLYECWLSMRKRCYYEGYHGRRFYEGVEVCDEWRDSFEAFCLWALANGYTDEMTLDRKESGDGYHPGNCQWLTKTEQAEKATATRLA